MKGSGVKQKGKGVTSFLVAQWLPLMVLALYGGAFVFSPLKARQALAVSGQTFASVLLIILAVVALTGFILVWIDRSRVARLLGREGGWRALFFAALCGMLLIGPPYVIFPLLLSIRQQGARWAVIVTVLAAWAVKIQLLPLEVQFLGWPFAIARTLLTLLLAIPVGLLVEAVVERGRPTPGD